MYVKPTSCHIDHGNIQYLVISLVTNVNWMPAAGARVMVNDEKEVETQVNSKYIGFGGLCNILVNSGANTLHVMITATPLLIVVPSFAGLVPNVQKKHRQARTLAKENRAPLKLTQIPRYMFANAILLTLAQSISSEVPLALFLTMQEFFALFIVQRPHLADKRRLKSARVGDIAVQR
ncbi:hypothetical protein EDD16DRAFT_1519626 [Pisolithus croceorrhizus]|nr:hypothetical protein EDD16DRAFT_1519626 [Pisolithus croceorrhizus]